MRKPRAALMPCGAVLAAIALIVAVTGAQARASHSARAVTASGAFHSRVFANATKLTHLTAKGRTPLANPDDITILHGHIFVGFQNGVGPQGEASTTGNRDSTVVEFALDGRDVAQWDVAGKCDGLTADPALGGVVATVNEDAHSSFYVIRPSVDRVTHYRYSEPLPSHGGTDAIDVYRGMLLFSASAPGTTGTAAPQADYPAVYRVHLDPATAIARITGLFSDDATAHAADPAAGSGTVRLALTDPDSNETVPPFARRFAGDFMLTSQGDKEQIFVAGAGTGHQSLSVLKLSDSVDDTVWASGRGAIYVDDTSAGMVEQVTGPFRRGSVFAAVTPCDANGAPSTCPGPGFSANYLGALNPETGALTRVNVTGPAVEGQGMLFLPGR